MSRILYMLAAAAFIFAVLRMLEDGQFGEVVTAVAVAVSCTLFVGGAVISKLERMRQWGGPKDPPPQ